MPLDVSAGGLESALEEASGIDVSVSRSAEGEIEMKFDTGEVHKYDLISQRKLRPILVNAHELTATALFDTARLAAEGYVRYWWEDLIEKISAN